MLHVYHISQINIGDHIILTPKIPEWMASTENQQLKRICVSTSIYGCIAGMPWGLRDRQQLYLYEADIPWSHIYQPKVEEVPDVWITGELWVIKNFQFKRTRIYDVTRQMRIVDTPYSRFIFHDMISDDIVCDRYVAETIYGEEESFSILALDEEIVSKKENQVTYAHYANSMIFNDNAKFRDIVNFGK